MMSKETTNATSSKPKDPFLAPEGKTPVVLLPISEFNRNKVLELLEKQVGENYEMPKAVDQLRLPQLSTQMAVFTAIAYPIKFNAKKQPIDWTLRIAGPIDLRGYEASPRNALDILDIPTEIKISYGDLVDRFAKGVVPHYTCRLSEDNVLTLLTN